MPVRPLLLVSDGITSPSGLGRITRELAIRIGANMKDVYCVAVAGYGGIYSTKFPFPQYSFQHLQDWSIPELPSIWHDFAGDEHGIIFFVWNGSWLPWVADPSVLPDCDLKTFLTSGRFEKWIYAPIDAEGPNGRLPESQRKIYIEFDRVLAYTEFGSKVLEETIGSSVPHLPHGTDENI